LDSLNPSYSSASNADEFSASFADDFFSFHPALRCVAMPGIRVTIDDVDDPRLAIYRHLKTHNLTRRAGQFVVEGEKLFDRLLASRFPVASVLVSEGCEAAISGRVPEGVPLYVLPHAWVEALVGFNLHRGVLACGHRRPWPGLDELTASAAPGPGSTLVVCPQLDNPENLGALLRIADVFGVLGVVVGARCPDPLSRRVLRVSMDMALRVPVVTPDDLAAALAHLRTGRGYRLAAMVVEPHATPLERYEPPPRLAVLLGCEAHGLDPVWLRLCDDQLTIPMRPGAESLNVAVAAGIIVHHLTRPDRRSTSPRP
jgi:tRNA G18 (ribose-2'-O)-methylase SpoU